MSENAQRERDSEPLLKWEVVSLMLDTTDRRHPRRVRIRRTATPVLGEEMETEGGYQITTTVPLPKPIGVISFCRQTLGAALAAKVRCSIFSGTLNAS